MCHVLHPGASTGTILANPPVLRQHDPALASALASDGAVELFVPAVRDETDDITSATFVGM